MSDPPLMALRQVTDLAEEQRYARSQTWLKSKKKISVFRRVCDPPSMALRQVTDLAQEQEEDKRV